MSVDVHKASNCSPFPVFTDVIPVAPVPSSKLYKTKGIFFLKSYIKIFGEMAERSRTFNCSSRGCGFSSQHPQPMAHSCLRFHLWDI